MSRNTNLIRAFNDSRVYYAPLGTALPTDLTTDPVTLGFKEVGMLSDAGTTESHSYGQETQVWGANGSLVAILRSQEARSWGFTALETNPNINALLYPGATPTTVGGTASVQTITISGSPTAGTFNVTLAGFGSASNLAYNITNSALATALSNAFGITVTVAGTGSTYTVTFPTSAGNVPQMTVDGTNLTGGTPSISVTMTTPGVAGVTTTPIGSATSRYLGAWVIDEFGGSYHERFTANEAEAVQSGDVTRAPGAATEYAFTLTTYQDSNGIFSYKIQNG